MATTGAPWTPDENRITVEAYLGLLQAQFEGRPVVKADVNHHVQEQIGRSRASIEYKFRNLSAVLRDLRHPFVSGYKPARNYQASLRDAAIEGLRGAPGIMDLAFEAVTRDVRPEELRDKRPWRRVDAPDMPETRLDQWLARAMRRDYVKLEEENRRLGHAGELAVLRLERERLTRVGRSDLAERVEHVSVEYGDGPGFDIRSFEDDGADRLIEVKTTRQGQFWPILVSSNEVRFSAEAADCFQLYRVFDFSSPSLGLYTVAGDLSKTFSLKPTQFEGLPVHKHEATPHLTNE